MPNSLPPLAALAAFEAAARYLSFKKAAEELCVTPSSISHQIKRLEERLDVSLFVRFNREVALTQDGVHYAAAISAALADIAHATNEISRRDMELTSRSRLIVSANSGFIDCWLNPRLEAFTAEHPEIELELHYGEDFSDYRNRDADVAVHFSSTGAPSEESEILFRGVEFPVCSPDLEIDGRPLNSLEDLAQIPLLHEHDRIGWRRWLQAAGIESVDASRGPVFQNTQTIFNRVAACDGVGLGDEFVAYDAIMSGQLIKPFPVVRDSDWTVYLIPLRRGHEARASDDFCRWLKKTVQKFSKQANLLRRPERYSNGQRRGV